MGFEAHELAGIFGVIPWRAYSGHEIEEYEIVDAKTENPVEGMTYKLISGSGTRLDAQTLENGRTKPYAINEHPDLSFIAWIKGPKK